MPYERELPGGRQAKTGPDAVPVQNEAFEGRALRIPAFGGLIVSTRGELAQHNGSTNTLVANTLYLFPMLFGPAKVMTLVEARIRLTATSAGSHGHGAIYRYRTDTRKQFDRIPGSQVRFDTSGATGNKTDTCKCELVPGELYYIGLLSTSAVPSYLSPSVAAGASSTTFARVLSVAMGSAELPASVALAQLTKAANMITPEISYYTQEGVALL